VDSEHQIVPFLLSNEEKPRMTLGGEQQILTMNIAYVKGHHVAATLNGIKTTLISP